MKSVLISIQPKWCELIASGKKTVEVRKTRPKLDTPFKCYIYCTQGEALAYPCLNNPNFAIHRTYNSTLQGRQMTPKEREQSDHLYANGKVIGEFVCDSIEGVDYNPNYYFTRLGTCLEPFEMWKYGKGKPLYAWHISDLVIYDKPRELNEFYKRCYCGGEKCQYSSYDYGLGGDKDLICTVSNKKPITRPPQSWCYVESEELK